MNLIIHLLEICFIKVSI